jgi:hypothetical protein
MTDESAKEHMQLLEHLTAALTERTEKAIADRIALRNAVCAYVAVEQSRGTSLNDLIVEVSAILRKAEAEADASSDELAAQLIAWCIQFNQTVVPPDVPGKVLPVS